MDEGFTKREKLVGLFLLLIVILTKVTLLVIAQGKGWWQSYRSYYVILSTGYNLHPGSLVKIFNTEVGKVTKMSITREKDGTATVKVSIKILTEYIDFIRTDCAAEVVSPTLFGSEYLEITPSYSNKPLIDEHDEIPYFQKKKPFTDSLAELLNEGNLKQAQAILTNLTLLSGQLQNDEKNWNAAVKHVNEVAESLLKSQGTLGELLMSRDFAGRMTKTVESMDRALKEVNQLTTDFKPSAKNLEVLTQNLIREVAALKSILEDIKGGSPEVPKAVEAVTEFGKGGAEVVDAVKANPLIRMTLPKGDQGQSLHVEPRHVK